MYSIPHCPVPARFLGSLNYSPRIKLTVSKASYRHVRLYIKNHVFSPQEFYHPISKDSSLELTIALATLPYIPLSHVIYEDRKGETTGSICYHGSTEQNGIKLISIPTIIHFITHASRKCAPHSYQITEKK